MRITAPAAMGTAGAAAAVAAAVTALHRAGRLPGGSTRWQRTNHAGDAVTLTEGVAVTAGTMLPLLVVDPPGAVAVAGAGAAGALDDLRGGTSTKGLKGHLRALRRGEVTTGAIKIGALAASGLLACAWSDHRDGAAPTVPQALSTLAGGALVAGSANLANLLDLRPGRALKVALALGIPLGLSGRASAAAVTGAALTQLPADLKGEAMLGDTGANPLGAAVGLAAAQALGPVGRGLALAGVTALTLASEKVSFSAVIDDTPVLRSIDRWGRPR